MRVFVTRAFPGAGLERLAQDHEVDLWERAGPPPYDELVHRAELAHGILSMLTDTIDEPLLRRCGRLRVVSNLAVGFENIDIGAATTRHVPIGHTPGVLTEATAQLTITMILDLLRRVSEASTHVRAGEWQTWDPSGFLGRELGETTLGLIGYGRIGRSVAAMGAGLGMRVQHTAPRAPGGIPLTELLETSDVVSLHALLNPQTRGLIDAAALARMRPGSLLVNVARGGMVVTDDLVRALDAGHLGGAALDVTDPEPLPPSHPLLRHRNVLVTPHIASATRGTRGLMGDMAVDNLLAGLDGQPLPHCANPEVYTSRSAHLPAVTRRRTPPGARR